MAENIIKIRASSLSEVLDCSRRAAAKTFRTEIEGMGYELRDLENGIAAAMGTATHAGATWALAEKVRTGELGHETESIERAVASLHTEREAGVTFDATSPDLNTAQKQVIRQLTSYRTHVAPEINPVAVEQRLEGFTDETRTVLLSGQCDVSEAVAGDSEVIRDIKTGVKDKYHGAQLGSYSLLRRAHGKVISGIKVDFIPRVAINREQPPPQKISYDPEEIEKLTLSTVRKVKIDYDLFMATGEPNVLLPNPSSMLCSQKYCPAWGTSFCKHHAKREENVL